MASEHIERQQWSTKQAAIHFPPNKLPGFYAFILKIARIFMAIAYPLRIHGKDNLRQQGKQMLICNHQRWADIIAVATLQNRVTHFMGKAELFKIPVISWLLRRLGAFPVRRGQADIGAIKQAVNLLNQERVLCIFPEGTRNHDDKLKEFRKGAAAIALRAEAPILPIYIGKYRVFRPLQVWIGKPIDLTGQRSDEGTALIQQAIQELELEAKRYV